MSQDPEQHVHVHLVPENPPENQSIITFEGLNSADFQQMMKKEFESKIPHQPAQALSTFTAAVEKYYPSEPLGLVYNFICDNRTIFGQLFQHQIVKSIPSLENNTTEQDEIVKIIFDEYHDITTLILELRDKKYTDKQIGALLRKIYPEHFHDKINKELSSPVPHGSLVPQIAASDITCTQSTQQLDPNFDTDYENLISAVQRITNHPEYIQQISHTHMPLWHNLLSLQQGDIQSNTFKEYFQQLFNFTPLQYQCDPDTKNQIELNTGVHLLAIDITLVDVVKRPKLDYFLGRGPQIDQHSVSDDNYQYITPQIAFMMKGIYTLLQIYAITKLNRCDIPNFDSQFVSPQPDAHPLAAIDAEALFHVRLLFAMTSKLGDVNSFWSFSPFLDPQQLFSPTMSTDQFVKSIQTYLIAFAGVAGNSKTNTLNFVKTICLKYQIPLHLLQSTPDGYQLDSISQSTASFTISRYTIQHTGQIPRDINQPVEFSLPTKLTTQITSTVPAIIIYDPEELTTPANYSQQGRFILTTMNNLSQKNFFCISMHSQGIEVKYGQPKGVSTNDHLYPMFPYLQLHFYNHNYHNALLPLFTKVLDQRIQDTTDSRLIQSLRFKRDHVLPHARYMCNATIRGYLHFLSTDPHKFITSIQDAVFTRTLETGPKPESKHFITSPVKALMDYQTSNHGHIPCYSTQHLGSTLPERSLFLESLGIYERLPILDGISAERYFYLTFAGRRAITLPTIDFSPTSPQPTHFQIIHLHKNVLLSTNVSQPFVNPEDKNFSASYHAFAQSLERVVVKSNSIVDVFAAIKSYIKTLLSTANTDWAHQTAIRFICPTAYQDFDDFIVKRIGHTEFTFYGGQHSITGIMDHKIPSASYYDSTLMKHINHGFSLGFDRNDERQSFFLFDQHQMNISYTLYYQPGQGPYRQFSYCSARKAILLQFSHPDSLTTTETPVISQNNLFRFFNDYFHDHRSP